MAGRMKFNSVRRDLDTLRLDAKPVFSDDAVPLLAAASWITVSAYMKMYACCQSS